MKANDYKRVETLLATLDTEKKCNLKKLLDAADIYYASSKVEFSTESKKAFLDSWAAHDRHVEIRESLRTSISKLPKVRKFFAEPFVSGYAMGEVEKLVIVHTIGKIEYKEVIVIRDNRDSYSGKGAKYNSSAKYGEKILTVNVGMSKNSYAETIVSKNHKSDNRG